MVQLNSAQIRKDLAYFGELGIRGVGYDVKSLRDHLIRTMGLDKTRRVIIAGAGNLGLALANYPAFYQEGFSIVALLDSDPKKVGTTAPHGLPIHSIDDVDRIVREESVDIGVLAVPAEAAQEVYDRMAASRTPLHHELRPGKYPRAEEREAQDGRPSRLPRVSLVQSRTGVKEPKTVILSRRSAAEDGRRIAYKLPRVCGTRSFAGAQDDPICKV